MLKRCGEGDYEAAARTPTSSRWLILENRPRLLSRRRGGSEYRRAVERTSNLPRQTHACAHTAVRPPSTGSIAPLTKLASSETRYVIAAAISYGEAARPAGANAASSSCIPLMPRSAIAGASSATKPDGTLTLMASARSIFVSVKSAVGRPELCRRYSRGYLHGRRRLPRPAGPASEQTPSCSSRRAGNPRLRRYPEGGFDGLATGYVAPHDQDMGTMAPERGRRRLAHAAG